MKEWRAWEFLVRRTIISLERVTKNSEMKWVVTKGNENLSIIPLSFLGDLRRPMWVANRGSEFRMIRMGLDRIWNINVSTIGSWIKGLDPWAKPSSNFHCFSTTFTANVYLSQHSRCYRLWSRYQGKPASCRLHWGQGPKYSLGTWWKHWNHSQHVTLICPVVKCWVHFEYTLLCDPDMPSGHMLSTFWMCPAIWLQCTQWPNNRAHFQCSAKCDHNVPTLGTNTDLLIR